MLVKNWMSKKVISIDKDESIHHAMKLMKEHKIRMLPVFTRDKLVGVITDRDLRSASASKATTLEIHELAYLLAKIRVKDIMTGTPVTIPFNYTIEETAEILLEKKINGVPVVDNDGKTIGVITQTDILKAMISLTGLLKGGILFAFRLKDEAGSIKLVTDVIRGYGGRIASILSSYDNVQDGWRKVYIRVYGDEIVDYGELKEKLIRSSHVLYVVDLVNGKREIFENG